MRIRIIDENDQLLAEPFLDISGEVDTGHLEQGLLGLAFHPQYEENGLFYVNYTEFLTNGDTFVAEYQVSADNPNQADPTSRQVLLTFDQPHANHNGGPMRFGPDGYLYIATGDSGLGGDPYEQAQDITSLLGKILRIDVNGEGDAAYTIPDANPFEGEVVPAAEVGPEAELSAADYHPGARPEIWAFGLRNPYYISFDRATGDLYIADVGQEVWEEINVQPAGSEGGRNYGWDVLEGAHCYPAEATACAAVGVPPVAEYNHTEQGESCSISGIGVYRGQDSPSLDGIYFVSDSCSGLVWGLTRDAAGTWVFQQLLDTALLSIGAGEDEAGELYLAACQCEFGRDYDPFANPGGTIWRIVAAAQVPAGAETAPTGTPAVSLPPEPEDEKPGPDGTPATPASGS